MTRHWWWGTYPEAGLGTTPGRGEGLWRMEPLSGGFAQLVVELPAPSFVVAHPDVPVIYAVTEEEKSSVACIDVSDPASPRVAGRVPSGGWGACHAHVSRDTLTLYVSHYSSGHVAVIPLAADGAIAVDSPLQVFEGSGTGPVPRRQEGPHAHFAGYAPGEDVLLVADLGADVLRRFAILGDGSLVDDGVATRFDPGSGPRHFAVRGDLIYVACELSHRIVTLRWDGETRAAEKVGDIATTAVPLRSGEEIYDAHVAFAGDVLLASTRGPDVISVYDLDSSGLPSLRCSIDSGGEHPRYFAVFGERLVVGNEKSHLVSVFDLADVLSAEPGDDPSRPVVLAHLDARVLSPACVCEA